MKKSISQIKIPTYLGLILLMVILLATSWIAGNSTFINSRANTSTNPEGIKISNITDTSFTVSYATAEKTTGSVLYGEKITEGIVALDDRDKTAGNPSPHQMHYFTIEHLKPATLYNFTILSGDTKYDNSGSAYSVTTATTLSPDINNNREVTGTVILPDGSYPKEAVTYIQSINSQLLSVPIQNDGSYHFSLNLIRTQALDKYVQILDTDLFALTVVGDGYQATAKAYAKDAAHVPLITLSQQYIFTSSVQATPIDSASSSALISPANLLPKLTNENTIDKNPQILVPQKDQAFDDRQPEFTGTALPLSNVDIVIQSANQIRTSIQTDASGNWVYRPDTPLAPGTHTITITTRNESGLYQTIMQSFIVHAEGSQFIDPSVSPTQPNPSPTTIVILTTPTITVSNTPVIIPTVIPSPTLTVPTITIPTNIIMTPTPIIITNAPVTPVPTIEQTGVNNLFITGGLITFATFISIMIFFLIRV